MGWIILLLLVGVLAGSVFLLYTGRAAYLVAFLCSLLLAGVFTAWASEVRSSGTNLGSWVVAILLFSSAILTPVVFGVWLLRPAPRSSGCPLVSQLRDFVAERLPSRDRVRVAAHLEACPVCQRRLEQLTAGRQSWPVIARRLAQARRTPEPALRRVMDQLREKEDLGPTCDEVVVRDDLPLGFLEPPEKPGLLGRLGPYEVQSEIGRGGMGIVLRAFDPALHRVVAIKVLAPQLATSGVARQRFRREAQAAAAVSHDHVVTIYAVEENHGLPYLVMQYIPGMSLQERIDREGPLPLKEILRVGMQTAAGLAAAHAQGIIHRDVKPANILLENGIERVKLTDFGLARAVDDASLTQSGFVAGSPQYMAPEQARGEALDCRADLFSLGSVLYTMCTGRPPFRGANTFAVLRRVSEDTPRPIREVNPEVPDWLAAIIAKLHAKDPVERYQSAVEVAELLGQHLARLQQPAGGPVPPGTAPQTVSPSSNAAGVLTSLTICPNCAAQLHVPERMTGGTVYCPECGKPFRAEAGSEEIQIARPVRPPVILLPHARRQMPAWFWLLGGCAVLLAVLVLFTFTSSSAVRPARGSPTAGGGRGFGIPVTHGAQPFWTEPLGRLPEEITLFGAIDLKSFGSPTVANPVIQGITRLILPPEMNCRLAPEQRGQARIDSVSCAYFTYAGKPEGAYLVQFEGLVSGGWRRLFTSLVPSAEFSEWPTQSGRPVQMSSPDLPFAMGLARDDRHVLLAGYTDWRAFRGKHRPVLEHVLWSKRTIANGYKPPWIEAALREIPPDAFGLLVGEIHDEVRGWLTRSLGLRVCPRSVVVYLKRQAEGAVVISVTLNVDKLGGDVMLQEDLDRWRRQALDVVKARFPGVATKPEALALLGQTLKTMRLGFGRNSVRSWITIPGPTWEALGELVCAAAPCESGEKTRSSMPAAAETGLALPGTP